MVAGGFVEATTVDKWSDTTLDLSRLEADHEEAETHLILHCIHALMESVVVSVRDADHLHRVLTVHHH